MRKLRGSELDPLEVASGLVYGNEPGSAAAAAGSGSTPLAAIEAAVLPALLRPPCLVSFSGGRDSSCVLAVAVAVARREGLDPPVAVTLRFPGLPEADEDDYQERVLRALKVGDWLTFELGADLDVVGPIATRVLRRHGLLWPMNTYVHQPLIEAARGGSFLTGVGGDELFEHMGPDRVHLLAAKRVRPVPRDLLRVGFAAAPRQLRRAVLSRREPLNLRWLVPSARRAVDGLWAADAAREPRRLAARARWWPRRRSLRVAIRSLAELAAEVDVQIAHPLAEPPLAAALIRDPALAFATREQRLEGVFGDLLPVEIYRRRSKASFNRALFARHARELVARWSGSHVDPEIVDRGALRAEWATEMPDGRSYLLLQSVWLADATRPPRAGAPSPPRGTSSAEAAEPRTRAERQA